MPQAVSDASKSVGLEVNTERIRVGMFVSLHQNVERNHDTKTN
jgi:hypothetical protein